MRKRNRKKQPRKEEQTGAGLTVKPGMVISDRKG